MKTLPDKWCIKQNISKEVCKWFAKKPNTHSANIKGGYTFLCFNEEIQSSDFFNTSNGYIEITLQDFKELVLKEKPMKYTIAQLTDPKNKYIVFIETKEQWNKLKTTKAELTSCFHGSYCYNLIRCTYSSSSTKNDVGSYPSDSKIIYFDQIDFEEETMIQNKEKLIELKENLDKVKETYLNAIKEVIPEYVLCTKQLGYCIVGKVYKTEKKNKSFRWLYEEFNCNTVQLINEYDYFGRLEATMKYFVPATKEQYNAQNTPKFKVGDWAYHRNNNQAYLITEFISTGFFKASFGDYCDWEYLDIGLCTKATEEQIKDSLLKEAEKRYPIGTRFIGLGSQEEEISEGYHHFYCGDEKFIAVNIDMGVVYRNGKWAEIIPEVEKWSVGTYVVFLSNNINGNNKEIGGIEKIVKLSGNKNIFHYQDGYCNGVCSPGIQWFATKEEAEEFAKTLKPQYQIGDYVKLIGNKESSINAIGDVGKITEINSSKSVYRVQVWGKGTCGNWSSVSDIIKTSEIELPFGNLIFTIRKFSYSSGSYLECKYGKISKYEVKNVLDWFNKDFNILGYKMEIVNESNWFIKFGCCEGTLEQLKAIYKAMQ